jgi:hypothetical protein
MKESIILLLIGLINSINCMSQEFSFPMYFEDAVGNKDTLVFGYDINATDSIDISLGEKDINAVKFDNVFEVRISDYYRMAFFELPFLTKRQILMNNCSINNYPYVSAILVKCKNYPLKIKWDKTVFADSCNNYTFITDWNPGGWFDAGGGYRFFLKDTNNCTFQLESQSYIYKISGATADTVGLLYFAIASKKSYGQITEVKLAKGAEIQVYPNPIKDKLMIKCNLISHIEVSIYDLLGNCLFFKNNVNEVDMTNIPKGLYFICVKLKNQTIIYNQKIIKL